jgi:hypothetical protein
MVEKYNWDAPGEVALLSMTMPFGPPPAMGNTAAAGVAGPIVKGAVML